MQILLIRHGQSEADILDVHEGRADFSLTDLGTRQAHLMAQWVEKHFPPEIIWSSTLKRAKETALILSNTTYIPIIFEEDLMEDNNGVLAGLTKEEARKIPLPKFPHESVENGESIIDFRARIEKVFSKIITTSTQERIAIVAHGGVISYVLQSFLRMHINSEYKFRTGDTGIHLLEIKEKNRIIHFLNNTEHLD